MNKLQTSLFVACACLTMAAQAESVTTQHVELGSIESAGRNIMRTADGGIVASYVKTVGGHRQLVFATSQDNGATWKESMPTTALRGQTTQAAVDSNFQGSYIAFVETVAGKQVGRIAFTSAPFASNRRFNVSPVVTPAGVIPADTFIQASRAGWGDKADQDAETVAYGWQDTVTKALYVGVSPDGRTFPEAQKVITDPFATSGPAVAIRGKYIFISYLTKNPEIAPQDIPASERGDRSYQAWSESRDGGLTWLKPQPLFGTVAAAYPQLPRAEAEDVTQPIRLDGGTNSRIAAALAWSSPGKNIALNNGNRADTTGIIFIQSDLVARDSTKNKIGIVSFKPMIDGGTWTHVVANNKVARQSSAGTSANPSTVGVAANDVVTAQFQYSALVDTPVRASTYQEITAENKAARLVIVASVDTGKVFDHYSRLTAADLKKLGVKQFDQHTKFEVSQCLFEDREGNVHVDALVSNGDDLQYVRLPIGVNTKATRLAQAQKIAFVQ